MRELLEGEARFFIGHIHAVNAAAIAFAVLFGVKGLMDGASSSVPFPDRIWSS